MLFCCATVLFFVTSPLLPLPRDQPKSFGFKICEIGCKRPADRSLRAARSGIARLSANSNAFHRLVVANCRATKKKMEQKVPVFERSTSLCEEKKWECLLTRQPHLQSVLKVGFRAFKSLPIGNALGWVPSVQVSLYKSCRVNSNTPKKYRFLFKIRKMCEVTSGCAVSMRPHKKHPKHTTKSFVVDYHIDTFTEKI